jgi:hypothetical protein
LNAKASPDFTEKVSDAFTEKVSNALASAVTPTPVLRVIDVAELILAIV